MHSRKVQYACFLTPGSFVSTEKIVEVDSLDPYAVVWPQSAYAFRLYEREDIVRGDEVFKGEDKPVGPLYYHPDSRGVTREEIVARNDPRDHILLRNMEINGWDSVVYSRWGNWPQPYRPGEDVILEKRHDQVP